MSMLELLGVKPIINAAGPVTRLSGALMSEEVIEAMAEAIQPTAQLLSSGVAMRHPDMNFVMVECGGGWLQGIPFLPFPTITFPHVFAELPRPNARLCF